MNSRVFGSNVVDRESKNNHQVPKSRANPNHVPGGKKLHSSQQESNSRTSDHIPKWKQKLGMSV
jgi:hypothetical protein